MRFTEQNHLSNKQGAYLEMLQVYKEEYEVMFAYIPYKPGVQEIKIIGHNHDQFMTYKDMWVKTDEFMRVLALFCSIPYEIETAEVHYVCGIVGPYNSFAGMQSAINLNGYSVYLSYVLKPYVINDEPKRIG